MLAIFAIFLLFFDQFRAYFSSCSLWFVLCLTSELGDHRSGKTTN
jgi:hypothetical protein